MTAEKPIIRWGIVTVGMISSWFVEDLSLDRPDAPVQHVIQAIGSRDKTRAEDFVKKYCPQASPTIYEDYSAIYNDRNVDVVYFGSPHAYHHAQVLEAIAAGKNIFCEKPFTINSKETQEIFDAAVKADIYVAEAMWLRHRPLVHKLRKLLFEEKVIGNVYRTFCDFAMEVDIASLPATSRYKDLSLGAGTLLDIGIYSLTWAILTLDAGSPTLSELPLALAVQSHEEGIEVNTSVLLQYQSTGRQGIISSTTKSNATREVFCTIHGDKGFIEVSGTAPSTPLSFTVYPSPTVPIDPNQGGLQRGEGTTHEFPRIGRGFVYEADNTALDILAGRKESSIMPKSETLSVMKLMDSIRKQGNTFYPGHDEDL